MSWEGIGDGFDQFSESWNWKMTNSHKEGTISARTNENARKSKTWNFLPFFFLFFPSDFFSFPRFPPFFLFLFYIFF